jgi:nucleoside-diphosphate-sugar epimerase
MADMSGAPIDGGLVALTGATGFIGRRLLLELPRRGFRMRALLRRPSAMSEGIGSAVIGDLRTPLNMATALSGVDAVIHSAAIGGAVSGLPEDDYRTLNTEATLALAEAARRAGVKRFVFLSSVRAQCGAWADAALTEDREARPTNAYGRSKLAAEQALAQLEIDWVSLRLATVVGPGAKGNIARLLQVAASPYPLPLGGLTAKRSLLSIEGLLAAIETALTATGRLGRPLLVADAEPLSVGEMVAAVRQGMGRRAGLLPAPHALVRAAFALTGRGETFDLMARPLVVDTARLRTLGWSPVASPRPALASLGREAAASAIDQKR